jgi:hypothetical protein
MSEFTDEIDCYKYLLRLSEELWKNAGVPEDLKKKYELIKEKSFEKVRVNKMKNDCTFKFFSQFTFKLC